MKSSSSSGVQVVFLWTGTAFCSSTVLNTVQEHAVVQLCSRCQRGDTWRNSTGRQGVEIFVAGNHLCAIAGTQASSGCLCEPLFGSQTCSCISSCLNKLLLYLSAQHSWSLVPTGALLTAVLRLCVFCRKAPGYIKFWLQRPKEPAGLGAWQVAWK